MITETKLQKKLESLHTEALATVIAHIKRIKALVKKGEYNGLMLKNPIMYQYINDVDCEVISIISMDEKIAVVDTGDTDREELLNELKTSTLIAIVGQLELFKTFKDVKNELI